MALEVKVQCEDEIHIIGVMSMDPWGYELRAEIAHPGHDYSYDVGAHEFGYALPYCYTAVEIIEKGFDALFADTKLRQYFLQAVSEHGAESLGIESDELAGRITQFLLHTYDTYTDAQVDAFLKQIRTLLPWFCKTAEFRRDAGMIAETLIAQGDMEALEELLRMKNDVVVIKMRGDGEDAGNGHIEATVTFILYVNDSEIFNWQAHYVGLYWDLDTMEWHVERQSDSGQPEEVALAFIEFLGHEDIEEYELSNIDITEPGYHEPDGKGNWGVFLDDELWGQYKSESHAQETYDAMIDADEFSERSSGRYITLRRRTDPDGDEWEEVE